MFLHVCVCQQGGIRGSGACVAGGVHGGGQGGHGRGHVWQGGGHVWCRWACIAGWGGHA